MKTRAPIGLALAAALVVAGSSGASTGADAVTLSVRRYVNANKVRVLVWFGQVASSAAGEDVEVLGRDCLTDSYRLLAATKTVAGGGWQVESVSPDPPYQTVFVNSGTTFRARWKDELSAPYLYRLPLRPYALELRHGMWTVKVNPSPHNMKLAGKIVELQRFRSGKWVRYKRARLVYKPSVEYGGAYNYQAVFKVPTRRLKLRAFVPVGTAAQCYLAGASQPFRS